MSDNLYGEGYQEEEIRGRESEVNEFEIPENSKTKKIKTK